MCNRLFHLALSPNEIIIALQNETINKSLSTATLIPWDLSKFVGNAKNVFDCWDKSWKLGMCNLWTSKQVIEVVKLKVFRTYSKFYRTLNNDQNRLIGDNIFSLVVYPFVHKSSLSFFKWLQNLISQDLLFQFRLN